MSQRLEYVDLLTSVGQTYLQLIPCCMIMICVVDVIECLRGLLYLVKRITHTFAFKHLIYNQIIRS